MSARPALQCNCSAYRFPHRAGGGTCEARPLTRWDSWRRAFVAEPQPLCAHCGRPTDAVTVDFGIGPYEAWGVRGWHRDVHTVSECCEASLVDNTNDEARMNPQWFKAQGEAA